MQSCSRSLRRATSAALLATAAFVPLTLAATDARAALVISTGATANVTCNGGVCTATARKAVLNVGQLQSLLASSSVTVRPGRKASDIDVAAPLTWASSNSLTLDAYTSIVVNKTVSVSGPGALTLTTDDGGKNGTLSFGAKGNVTFLGLTNVLTINGAAFTLVGNIATLASDIATNAGGNYALANTYDAKPDGTYSTSPIPTAFTGTFEGLGNKISNLTISDRTHNEIGLFANIQPSGTVRDIGLTNATVRSALSVVGILVGSSGGAIAGAYSSGSVSGNRASAAGGLVGDNEGSVDSCYSTASVSGGIVGGLAGDNGRRISKSYATGSVDSLINYGSAGGLVGQNYSSGAISDSYAMGAANGGKNAFVGGFVGINEGSIATSYSTGIPSAPDGKHTYIGGFAGGNFTNGVIASSYWDTTTSGTNEGVGTGSVAGVTGLTTQQLQSGLPAGFNPAIWSEKSNINGGLPYLLANPPP